MKTKLASGYSCHTVRHLVGGVIVCAFLLGTAPVSSWGATPGWEVVSTRTDFDEPDRIETTVRDGYIYVTTARSVTVRLYSILGQLISQQTVNPGTTRLKVSGRGVYILKIGSLTRRITV